MEEEKVYIAVYNGECSIGKSIEEANKKLEEDCTHAPEFIDIDFYEAKLLKVKQIIIIENEENKSFLH
jgi:hypothetical protein